MSYKIAIASSDGKTVNQSFGECEEFKIYEINEQDTYILLESRICQNDIEEAKRTQAKKEGGCCCGGNGRGCSTVHGKKVESLSDCTCILCIRAGEKVKKLFAGRGISLFEIDGDIEELLAKIIVYYARAKKREVKYE